MKLSERRALLTYQHKIALCIDNAADASGNERRLSDLVNVIERQEKEHRAFGRSLVGTSAAKGRASLRAAVNHFLCKVIHDGISVYQCGKAPIESLKGCREDYVLGAILCSDSRFTDALMSYVRKACPDMAPTDAIERAASVDYCGAIAPEVK